MVKDVHVHVPRDHAPTGPRKRTSTPYAEERLRRSHGACIVWCLPVADPTRSRCAWGMQALREKLTQKGSHRMTEQVPGVETIHLCMGAWVRGQSMQVHRMHIAPTGTYDWSRRWTASWTPTHPQRSCPNTPGSKEAMERT